MSFLKKITPQKAFLLIIVTYTLLAIAAGIQSYLVENKSYPQYTCYNNYVIFKQSHFHLLNDNDLYVHYYDEHGDLFKYSPTFSLFFGAFAWMPDIIGLILWNILNGAVFFLAIYLLPYVDNRKKIFILLLCIIELMTAMQNEQSNALVAGLIILGYVFLEKRKYLPATLFIMLTVYIKLFGLVAFALFLLYPKKWKLAAYSALWAIVLFAAPLLVTDFSQLKLQYASWGNMLQNDHSASLGISVMGIIQSWFSLPVNKLITVLAGAVLFCVPLVQFKKYSNGLFRLLVLSSVLIWVIIFNHKAESSTFIIAMAGAAIWFFSAEKNYLNISLIILAFILVSLSPTDIFPRSIRENYVVPYALKALPCVLIWGKILFDMFWIKPKGINKSVVGSRKP